MQYEKGMRWSVSNKALIFRIKCLDYKTNTDQLEILNSFDKYFACGTSSSTHNSTLPYTLLPIFA